MMTNLLHWTKHLPNFCTLCHLTFGCLGIGLALYGQVLGASLCIWFGAVLDWLDGSLARWLHAHTPLGQQLDSLADLVTFGCLPASIVYVLLSQHTASPYLPFVALLLPNFAALRLARFNVDTRQHDCFIGLPTPAHALLLSTLPWLIANGQPPWLAAWLSHPLALAGVAVLSSCLLVANMRLMAFKFTTYAWGPNRFKYNFLLTAAALTLLLHAEGLALSIVLYLLLSLTHPRA